MEVTGDDLLKGCNARSDLFSFLKTYEIPMIIIISNNNYIYLGKLNEIKYKSI